MDLVEDMDDLIDRHFANRQDYQRLNPLEDIESDRVFQSRYRFNKGNFERLTEELTPLFDVRRSEEACSVEHIVGSALEMMAGGHFFRLNGNCGGISLSTAHRNLYRFYTINS